MVRRVGAVLAGAGSAMWPLLAFAEGGNTAVVSRAVTPPADAMSVMLFMVLTLLGLFGVAGLGWAYRQQRHLDWTFQQPDAPHDAHH